MPLKSYAAMTAILLLSFLTGCSGENRPTKSELSTTLADQLPDYLKLSSLSVEAMENTGNEVDPNYIARFSAIAETQSVLYTPDGSDGDWLFVKQVTAAGESVELFGKSSSVLYQGGWRHSMGLDGNPISPLGKPLASFAPRQTLIRGSDEEQAHLAALETADAEFNASILSLPINKLITEYYNTSSEWAGRFVVHEVLASRNEKRSNEEFIVHAKYSYRTPESSKPSGDDRRTFHFRKSNNQWQVVQMGGARSGRI